MAGLAFFCPESTHPIILPVDLSGCVYTCSLAAAFPLILPVTSVLSLIVAIIRHYSGPLCMTAWWFTEINQLVEHGVTMQRWTPIFVLIQSKSILYVQTSV